MFDYCQNPVQKTTVQVKVSTRESSDPDLYEIVRVEGGKIDNGNFSRCVLFRDDKRNHVPWDGFD